MPYMYDKVNYQWTQSIKSLEVLKCYKFAIIIDLISKTPFIISVSSSFFYDCYPRLKPRYYSSFLTTKSLFSTTP